MQSDWPQIPPEWWDESGAHIIGLCTGPVRESRHHGHRVQRGTGGDDVIFPVPRQTQFVLVFEDGVLYAEEFDPGRHGEIGDIPRMETSPPGLLEQLYGEGGTEEIGIGQQFNCVRKTGCSRTHWPVTRHPTQVRR